MVRHIRIKWKHSKLLLYCKCTRRHKLPGLVVYYRFYKTMSAVFLISCRRWLPIEHHSNSHVNLRHVNLRHISDEWLMLTNCRSEALFCYSCSYDIAILLRFRFVWNLNVLGMSDSVADSSWMETVVSLFIRLQKDYCACKPLGHLIFKDICV